MKVLPYVTTFVVMAAPVMGEQVRQLDAHEHGVGQLNIAFEGQQIAMELRAPGADIVGFEYVAESAADRAAIDAGVATLARPLDLFVLTDAAGCSVVQASAALESEDDVDHDDHEEDEHDHAHDHEEEHADEEEHAHDDHEDHADHTEFYAEYLLECADPTAVADITFAYFDAFPNALEVEVQVISAAGATAFEVVRETPTLDLRGMF